MTAKRKSSRTRPTFTKLEKLLREIENEVDGPESAGMHAAAASMVDLARGISNLGTLVQTAGYASRGSIGGQTAGQTVVPVLEDILERLKDRLPVEPPGQYI